MLLLQSMLGSFSPLWLKLTILINFPVANASVNSALVIFAKSHLFPNTFLNYSEGREAQSLAGQEPPGTAISSLDYGEESKVSCPCL